MRDLSCDVYHIDSRNYIEFIKSNIQGMRASRITGL